MCWKSSPNPLVCEAAPHRSASVGLSSGRSITVKGHKADQQREKEKAPGTKVSGKHTQASKSPPSVKSHRMCLIASATDCYSEWKRAVHQGNSFKVRFWCFFFNCSPVSHLVPRIYQNSRLLESKQVLSIKHCLHYTV